MSEHDEQTAFFSWIDAQLGNYPILILAHAVINGAKLPYRRDGSGKRYSPEANNLIREGLRAGVPDVHLPYPSGPYAGLWIEFKYDKNKPTPKQSAYLKCLALLGYCVNICYDWISAARATIDYLRLKDQMVLTDSIITTWHDEKPEYKRVDEKLFELLDELKGKGNE